jgi:ATP-dependent Lhr-like helicase
VSWDNFALRIQGEPAVEELEAAVHLLHAAAPEGIVAAVDERALEGLKFAECLPPDLAVAVVRARLADLSGIANILDNPVRLLFDH